MGKPLYGIVLRSKYLMTESFCSIVLNESMEQSAGKIVTKLLTSA